MDAYWGRRVGGKAELAKCLTQAGLEVEPGGISKHEKLKESDWATGVVEDEREGENEGGSE